MPTTILSAQQAQADYFAALAQARPVAAVMAAQLQPFTASGARAVLNCGRFPVGAGRIDLFQRDNGRVYTRGAKWCASRYCPICQPRIMAALGWKRAMRARGADAVGYGVAFFSVDVPDCEPGELAAQLALLLSTFRAVVPSPSRLPVAWKNAGLSDFLGVDWNVEIDWNADTGQWHPHIHAVAFRASGPWTPAALGFLADLWPWSALADAQEAQQPEAVARYSVKAANQKPYLLSVFDLARHGMKAQVAEYLSAVQGIRLRAASPKLGRLLRLEADPDDADLLREMDTAPGTLLRQMPLAQWCRSW